MKKIGKIALIVFISCIALFLITIETNPDIAVKFGLASGPGKPDTIDNTQPTEQEVVVGGDLAPMVMIDGLVYVDIGEESTRTERNDGFDGEITSTVTQNQEPTENDQSNFGTGYGYQYGPNGTVEILMNEKWCVFVVMADAV